MRKLLYVPLGLLAVALLLLAFWPEQEKITRGNYINYCGWAGRGLAQQEARHLPKFKLQGPNVGDPTRPVLLWDFAKIVNGGKHLPHLKQETGDCTSFGAANAIRYLMCYEMVRKGLISKPNTPFPPFLYGYSRVQIGKGQLGRSAGSLGSWVARAASEGGVLSFEDPGVPRYSGGLADQWGIRGPPDQFLSVAAKSLIKTTALVDNKEDASLALLNGYPITVASSRGFRMQGTVKNGKLFGVPSGTWMHQMAFLGYDPDDDSFYCQNSWEEDMHGDEPDGAPPGGFWVDGRVADGMLRQGDSFAWSQFDGFPSQDPNFRVVAWTP